METSIDRIVIGTVRRKAVQMKALLLSINPDHVSNILNGTKRYEFRRSRCKSPVDLMVIYCTAPVKMVVGQARIVRVIEGNPEEVWNETKDAAGISRHFFDEYYDGRDNAVAYELMNVIRYGEPRTLSDYGLRYPPQSFCYVDLRLGRFPAAHPGPSRLG